jgi:hypothetical protein
MRHQRFFFIAVMGAILAVAAILAVILLVLGDNEEQGEDSGPDPSPESAPWLRPSSSSDHGFGFTALVGLDAGLSPA